MNVFEVLDVADPDVEKRTSTASKPKPGRGWLVVLHNDNAVEGNLVAKILDQVFGIPRASAHQLMIQVHQQGKGAVKMYDSRDIAETKVAQAEQFAEEHAAEYGNSAVPTFDVEEAD